MRILAALTILTMGIAGQAQAQTYGPASYGPWAYQSVTNSYCLQGRDYGYPGNCQYASYAQCMATASGTFSIAESIPTSRSPASGAATIDPDTERRRHRRYHDSWKLADLAFYTKVVA